VPAGSVAALILAGGRATRMGGGDKPLLTVGGKPLLAHILAALHPLPVAISANGDPARFAAFSCPVLDDGAFVGEGPLAGVLAGLDWAAANGHATLLTVPGDTPFIPGALAAALAPAPACAASLGRTHPLVALWPVSWRADLRAWLSRPGPRSVAGFALPRGMRIVDFRMCGDDLFRNLNTPDDVAAARRGVG